MKPEDVSERLEATPFRAFRIRLSDGQSFEVKHPEQALVLRHKVVLGLGGDGHSGFERDVHCSMLHITSIEDLQAA